MHSRVDSLSRNMIFVLVLLEKLTLLFLRIKLVDFVYLGVTIDIDIHHLIGLKVVRLVYGLICVAGNL